MNTPYIKKRGAQPRGVEMYNLKGERLKTFDSLAAAAQYLQEQGIAPKAKAGSISAAARGKRYSAYNHRWSYEGEPLANVTAKQGGLQRRTVEMYTLKGERLKTFESLTAAAQYLQKKGIAPTAAANNIGEAARGKLYSAYDRRWSFTGEPLPNATAKSSPKTRAVEMLTLEGEHLKTFDSLAAAAQYLQKKGIAPKAVASNIGEAARGKQYSSYGYKWRFTGEPLHKTAVKNRGAQRRAVEMYTLKGERLKTFESLTAAAQYLQEKGIAPKATASGIRAAARGKLYSAYDRRWSFTGEPLANATAKQGGLQRRAVEMYTLKGERLKTFESLTAAAQYLQENGIAPKAAATNIGEAARGKLYSAYDYRWRFTGEPLANATAKSSPKTRAVEMLTLEGKHLKTFESLAAAARYLQKTGKAPTTAATNISAAARGKQYSAYDRRWRYKVSSPSNLVGIGR